MSTMGSSRELTPKDCDFALSFAQTQLESLPGDVTDMANSAWQNRIIASVGLKFDTICQLDPAYVPKAEELLDFHAKRLAGLHQRISEGQLRAISASFLPTPHAAETQ